MNCKPGDLAIVIGARGEPQKIGLIVRVHRHVPQGEVVWGLWAPPNGGQHASDADVWLVEHEPTERFWLHADKRLIPIRPPKEQDEVSEVKEIEHV